jgi:hypothetical protein
LKLEKYFTQDEINFIKQYASQNNLRDEEAVIALAREMISTYSLKFVNGQTVLTMLDLLAMKMPMWMNMQLSALKQSYFNIRSTAQSIKSMEKPTLFEELMYLLRDKDLAQQFTSFLGGIFNTIQSFTGKPRNREEDKEGEEDQGEEKGDVLL